MDYWIGGLVDWCGSSPGSTVQSLLVAAGVSPAGYGTVLGASFVEM